MIGDLRITIRKGESKNLLNDHLNYTLKQLEDSATSGSIKLKSNNIKVRNVPPQIPVQPGLYTLAEHGRYIKELRSTVQIVEKKFEELDIDIKVQEEQYAAQEAEDFVNPASKEPIKKLDPSLYEDDEMESE